MTTINQGINGTSNTPIIISNITISKSIPNPHLLPTTINSIIIPSNNTHLNSTKEMVKKSSSGLSAGQICAIAIPCIALLLGALLAALLLKRSPTVPPMATIIPPESSSLARVNVPHEIIPQTIEQKPIETQVIKKIENPVVNPVQTVQAVPVQQVPVFQVQQVPVVPVQEVQMVPVVEEVQMVPVQEVQMVPVQEIQTDPVQEIVQVDAPMTHTRGLSSAVEFVEPPQ